MSLPLAQNKAQVSLGVAAVVLAALLPRFLRRSQRGVLRSADGAAGPVNAASEQPAFNESIDEYPQYDYVIVGGGTAGCVLAARLSEDPSKRVLLLEAGNSGKAELHSRIPITGSRLFATKNDWTIWTEPQPNLDNRELFWPRAKLIGGCSSINAMIFHFGSPSDFDEWAKIAGSDQWAWKNFQRYFAKFEGFTPHPSYPITTLEERGQAGPVQTGFFGYCAEWSRAVVRSAVAVGIPERADFNTSEGTLGAGKLMTYIDKTGSRSSAETSYLTADVLARPNLTIISGTHVTRVLLAQDQSGNKKAEGVEFALGQKQQRYRVRALSELVIACGAVHTPHLLMLSGIGPSDKLEPHGIPVLHELQGVGQHLQDHLSLALRFPVPSEYSLNRFALRGWRTVLALPKLFEWSMYGTGVLISNIAESAAFVRSSDNKLFPENELHGPPVDRTSGPDAPDIELLASPCGWWKHGVNTWYPPTLKNPIGLCTIASILLRPESRGEIRLRSSNPFELPVTDPRYLSSENDLKILVNSLRLTSRLTRTGPLASIIDRNSDDELLDHRLHDASDVELAAIIRGRIETLYHPTSTARMAPLADGGVVDANLKVYGIANLRICDASVFPTINSGHTAAPVFALAEKAADLIKADHV